MKEHLFGIFPCLGALQANKRKIYRMIVRDALESNSNSSKSGKIGHMVEIAKKRNCKIEYKVKDYLDRLVGNRPHQNVILQVSSLTYEKFDMEAMKDSVIKSIQDQRNKQPLWIALDQIQDPMNFGAILRSAGYFGADGIIATARNSCRLSPTVSKASAGTMEWMKIYGSEDLVSHLSYLTKSGWDIIGTTMPNDGDMENNIVTPCNQLVLRRPSVLVLGNEGLGIRDEVLGCCTKMTTIKSGSTMDDLDSLNVSVAAGILLQSLMAKAI